MNPLEMKPETKKQVDGFCAQLSKEVSPLRAHSRSQESPLSARLLCISCVSRLCCVHFCCVVLTVGHVDLCISCVQCSWAQCSVNVLECPVSVSVLTPLSIQVSMWVQLQVPKIEDGNNFGVAVQEKVFELMTNTRTKIEGFQTQISKYFSERGDAVAKASKQPHVGDYRQLVHELDQNQYCEIRIMVLEVRNTYAVLYDIISKNFDKIKKPRGDGKALIY
nr:PREDICTED: proteasome activator complex subunit 1-like [Lepisosteus oculatus]